MMKHIVRYFDRLEDHLRMKLSRRPIIYAFIGAVGIVFLWKGVWETAEMFAVLHGPTSILVGVALLLPTGLLVSFFVGEGIIISGIKGEKKLVEKTEEELKQERRSMEHLSVRVRHIEEILERAEGVKTISRD